MANVDDSSKPRYLLRTQINSFHYLYQDAEYLMSAARLPNIANSFEVTRVCRSAFLLYVLSTEGLINRALDHFLEGPVGNFFTAREDKFSTVDKWSLLVLLKAEPSSQLDIGSYPWSHLAELFRMRNDYVHPKHDRMAYYEAVTKTKMRHLDWKDIPPGSGLKETDFIYRQTQLPKDPYNFGIKQLEIVKKVIDDSVQKLDELLDGQITSNNWARNDEFKLFFPEGAQFDDVPDEST